MTTPTAPDIEIYIADITLEEATQWLNTIFSDLKTENKKKGMPKNAYPLTAKWNSENFQIVVFEKVVKGFTSIWLDSSNLPWADDEACAKVASKDLEKTVRVSAGSWQQDATENDWLEITPQGTISHLQWDV